MRPKIPETVEQDIEQEINEIPLYEHARCTSKTHFMVEAIKEKVEREKQKLEEQKSDTTSTDEEETIDVGPNDTTLEIDSTSSDDSWSG